MISIIIPVYNRAHLIEETLHSIIAQTNTNWECIIIDDGSTDNTIKVVERVIANDSRFKLFNRPSSVTKGPSACRNYAVSVSKGDYIQFFDSDDIMHSNHLELKLKAIKGMDISICKLKSFHEVFSENLLLEDNVVPIELTKNPFEAFVTGKFEMMMVAPLWRKNILNHFLPIREDLHLLEDHDLHARALNYGLKIGVVNKSLIFYRTGLQSTTNNFYVNLNTGLISYLEAKSTVLSLSNLNSVKLAILKNVLGYFRAGMASRNFKASETCLAFIKNKQLAYNQNLKCKLIRIRFFYFVFKLFKKGDTFFKPLFKL